MQGALPGRLRGGQVAVWDRLVSVIAAVLGGTGAAVEVATLRGLTAAGSHRAGAESACERAANVAVAASAPAKVTSAHGVMVALDGRIDNRRELARVLGRGYQEPGGDGSLVLAAFARWGEGCLPRMIGDFAFALWDGRRRRLLCGRDALGVRPLHYARVGQTLVVASEAQQLLSYPGVSRRPDAGMLVDYLVGLGGDLEGSWFAGIRAVPPGGLLSAGEGGPVVKRYWQPTEIAVAERRDPDETVECFWRTFRRAVADRLPCPGGASGVLLGGGLDSSAVAATAAELLGEGRRRELELYNVSFEELAPECDEGAYVAALSESLGRSVCRIPADATSLAEEWRKHPPPLESPVEGWRFPVREVLRRLASEGGILLTGHGGDAVVAGSAEVYADRLARGELGVFREMVEHSRRVSGASFSGLLRHWVLRPLLPGASRRAPAARGVPAWINPTLVRRFDLEGRLRRGSERPPAASRAGAVIRRQIEGLLTGEMLAVHWMGRAAAASGLEIRHPFLDRRLVELVLSTPPALLFRAGRYKELLRRALGERLPPLIRDRIGKTSFLPFLEQRWRRSGSGALRALLRSSALAEMGVVRGDRLRREVEAYLQGRYTRLRPYLWTIITAERWLKYHHAGAGTLSEEPGAPVEDGAVAAAGGYSND